jgi:hypothetical protein
VDDVKSYADEKLAALKQAIVKNTEAKKAAYEAELATAADKAAVEKKLDAVNKLLNGAIDTEFAKVEDRVEAKLDKLTVADKSKTYTGTGEEIYAQAREDANKDRIPATLAELAADEDIAKVFDGVVKQIAAAGEAQGLSVDLALSDVTDAIASATDAEVALEAADGAFTATLSTATLPDAEGEAAMDYYYSYFNELLEAEGKTVKEGTLTTEKTANGEASADVNAFTGALSFDVVRTITFEVEVVEETTEPTEETTEDNTDETEPETSDETEATEPETSDETEATEPETSDETEATEPETSDETEATEPETSDETEATEPETSDETEATEPETNESTEPTEPETNESTEPTEPDTNESTEPTEPETNESTEPTEPETNESTEPETNESTEPTEPDTSDSTEPTEPDTGDSTEPTNPTGPTEPTDPTGPTGPTGPTEPETQAPTTVEVEVEVTPKDTGFFFAHDVRPFSVTDLISAAKVTIYYVDEEGQDLASEEIELDLTNPEDAAKLAMGTSTSAPAENVSPNSVYEAYAATLEDPTKATYTTSNAYIFYVGDEVEAPVLAPDTAKLYVGVKGDANLDGKCDANDAAKVLKYAADYGAKKNPSISNLEDPTLENFVYFLADVNGETTPKPTEDEVKADAVKALNANDANAILVHAAKRGAKQDPQWGRDVLLANALPRVTKGIIEYLDANPDVQHAEEK